MDTAADTDTCLTTVKNINIVMIYYDPFSNHFYPLELSPCHTSNLKRKPKSHSGAIHVHTQFKHEKKLFNEQVVIINPNMSCVDIES
jgi:hypothetical protein